MSSDPLKCLELVHICMHITSFHITGFNCTLIDSDWMCELNSWHLRRCEMMAMLSMWASRRLAIHKHKLNLVVNNWWICMNEPALSQSLLLKRDKSLQLLKSYNNINFGLWKVDDIVFVLFSLKCCVGRCNMTNQEQYVLNNYIFWYKEISVQKPEPIAYRGESAIWAKSRMRYL